MERRQLRFAIASEQLKLQLWSVIFGSLIIDVIILYAGNLFFLVFSGLIFGSMSRRGRADFWLCGLPSLISTSTVVIFFHLHIRSVSEIPFSVTLLGGYATFGTLMVSALLIGGISGGASSIAVIRYVRRKYGTANAAQNAGGSQP